MAYVSDVFDAAMGIMDELSASGEAQTADTQEYLNRTPAIVNMMVSELVMLTSNRTSWLPVEGVDDMVPIADDTYARSAMPYGLAANLLIDENPTAASFYQQRYEELKALYISRLPADMEDVTNLYGHIEYGEFARW